MVVVVDDVVVVVVVDVVVVIVDVVVVVELYQLFVTGWHQGLICTCSDSWCNSVARGSRMVNNQNSKCRKFIHK